MSLNKLFNFIVTFFKKLILSVWNYDLLKIIKRIKKVKFFKETTLILLLFFIVVFSILYYSKNNPTYHEFKCEGIQELEKEKYEWNKDSSEPKIVSNIYKSSNRKNVKFNYKSYFLNIKPPEANYEYQDDDLQDVYGHYFDNSNTASCDLGREILNCGYWVVFSSKHYLKRERGNILFNKNSLQLNRQYSSEYIQSEIANWYTGQRDYGDYNIRLIDQLQCAHSAKSN